MQGFEGQYNLSRIKFRLLFGEFVLGGQEAEKLASGTVLEEEVEFTVILEAHFHADQKGVLDL